jgi:hypothetical protein
MVNIYKFAAPVAAVIIIIAGAFYYSNQGDDLYVAFAPEISSVGENAFGSLVSQDGKGALTDQASSFAVPQAADSSEASALGIDQAISSKAIGIGAGGDGGFAEPAIWPGPQNYKYVYAGEEFSLEGGKINVLRRIKGLRAASAVASQLGKLDFGVFDINKFDTTKVQNLNFSEDKEFGHNVSINFTDGSISIHENWEKWEQPYNKCQDQACRDNLKLKETDIPSDEKLIDIANSFLRDRGISTSAYNTPFVDKEWRRYYDENQGRELYIPDSMQIKYPLEINGEEVYEQGGDKAAMTVNVNIRFKRAGSVWGLTSQQYESSQYTAETDAQKLIQIAEAGGLYGYLLPAKDAKEIKLGTPERVLLRQWNWVDGVNNELLVPALMFPVIEASKEVPYYQKRSITIPLAEELLVRNNGGVIMYLERDDVEVSLPPVKGETSGEEAPAAEIEILEAE